MVSKLKINKLNALPPTLAPNEWYLIKQGGNTQLYVADQTGTAAIPVSGTAATNEAMLAAQAAANDANALLPQMQQALTDVGASRAALEQVAGTVAVGNEAALTGKPAGGYTVIATGQRVYWSGSAVTARSALGGGPQAAPGAATRAPRMLLPLYVYPSNAYTNPVYNRLIDAARRYPGVEINVILNNSNGPGAAKDGNFTVAIQRLRACGNIRILGYVTTSNAARAATAVKADMDTWKAWYQPDGIFIDEMSNADNAAHVTYYADLLAYGHSIGQFPIIGNPGTAQLPRYFATPTADVICIYENSIMPDEAFLKGDFAGGYADYPTSGRAALAYAQPTFNTALAALFQKYTGMWFFTDEGSPVLWSKLPTYFEDMLAWMASGGLSAQNSGTATAINPQIVTGLDASNVVPGNFCILPVGSNVLVGVDPTPADLENGLLYYRAVDGTVYRPGGPVPYSTGGLAPGALVAASFKRTPGGRNWIAAALPVPAELQPTATRAQLVYGQVLTATSLDFRPRDPVALEDAAPPVFDNLTSYTLNDAPSAATAYDVPWAAMPNTVLVGSDAAFPQGRFLRLNLSSAAGTGRKIVTRTDSAAMVDGQLALTLKNDSGADLVRVYGRVSGAPGGGETGVGVQLGVSGAGQKITLFTLSNNVFSDLKTAAGAIISAPVALSSGPIYGVRLEVVGTRIRAKVWPVTGAEPGWMVTGYSDAVMTPGKVGLGGNIGYLKVGQLGYSKNSLPAPVA